MGNVTKVNMVKVHYLGDSEEPSIFTGVATGTPYKFGGRISLGKVDARDLTIGHSTHPGLLELTDGKGQKLFELWTPETSKQQREQERQLQEQEAKAEALLLPPEELEAKPKRKKKEPDAESPLPGD